MKNALFFFVLGIITGVMAVELFSQIPKRHTIFYDGLMFSPELLVIRFGDSVTVYNNSTKAMEVAAGKHENHKNLQGFEEKIVKPETTYTFTPLEKGAFDFHDHLNPKKLGILAIDE
ncbi:MAG: hypothetical protein A2782_03675 [Candidatus Blackburnbacteria bacterium RIFCSPHIGHO2_01_FULL_43_15b]|uniref:EfeO-type cupredoxin-like domain-containing protein n=1 Tax=Candidatus Blackburnbacteria bacterium RIFCSPHIGHO2_01_FULL_43_15b TaxID=1797513 RepID=A0A1G1UYA2_9BACT|nr:MAG: hypothetical protein A2782_03675 [Candidatus Blackburnbacteria bacterium RIFCSPHIGHO2_01_FULL_43_15b]